MPKTREERSTLTPTSATLADDADPPPTVVARPAPVIKLKDSLPKLLFESGLIVLSILLAFLMNEWREDRRNDQAVVAALADFRTEIQNNLRAVEAALPYHQQVLDSLDVTPADSQRVGRSNAFDLLMEVAPQGVQAPYLRSSAWETALARGALAHMDYETTSVLAGTYQDQQNSVGSTWPRLMNIIFDPSFFDSTQNRELLLAVRLSFWELEAQERTLIDFYRDALGKLEPE